MLTKPRWTHVAIPSSDLDQSIAFYTSMTPLVVVAEFSDDKGRSAWLSNEGQWETPFVLVLVAFDRDRGRKQPTMAPFAHIGVELPARSDVDAVAEQGRAAGCLHWEPQDVGGQVGYVCALTDPDGNVIEFSHGQAVHQTVQERWGDAARQAAQGRGGSAPAEG